MAKKTPSPYSLKVPVGNLAFASNILPGSAISYPYRYEKYIVSFVMLLMVTHIKYLLFFLFKFLWSPTSTNIQRKNMYEEVGDQK